MMRDLSSGGSEKNDPQTTQIDADDFKNICVHLRHLRITPLVAILALALLLRLIALNSRGMWYDDTFSVFLAEQPWGRIISGTAADTMPPLYYFLLSVWIRIGGEAVWWLRLLNVGFSLIVVAVVYGFTARLFGRGAAAWAAAFTAMSPLQIYHAQELRMYVTLTLGLALYAWGVWELSQSPTGGIRSGLLTIAGGAIAMYSHNLAIFTLAAPNAWLLWRRDWRGLARLIAAQAISGALALPWLVLVPEQVQKIQTAFWTPRPTLLQIVQALLTFHTNLPVPGWYLPIALLTSVLALTLVIFETIRLGRGLGRSMPTSVLMESVAKGMLRPDHPVGYVIALALIPPALLFVASYLMRPVFVPRAFMLSGLAYAMLAGRAVAGARVRAVGWALGALVILPALGALPAQYTFAEFPRSPFREAATALSAQAAPGDVILHDNKLSFFPSHFYARDLPQVFLPDPLGSHNDSFAPASQEAMNLFSVPDIATAVGSAPRVWFVTFARAEAEYAAQGQLVHPVLAWLRARYPRESVLRFNDLELYRYEK